MAPVPRRTAALVCIAALVALAGCSSSGKGETGGTTTTVVTPLTTSSPERVRVVGAHHIAIVRRILADERAACGADGIAPTPANAAKCRVVLAALSTAAHDFARALVFLRPAPELEPIV